MDKNKTDNELAKKLSSKNDTEVIRAIELIKEKGDESHLPGLLERLSSGQEESIENEIIYILNNLKIKKAAAILADALQNSAYARIRKTITTACWQNGLDYAPFLPVFVDLVIEESWDIGFEALTVIDSIENPPDFMIIEQEKAKIELALKTADEQKSYLLHEILGKI